MTIKTPWIAAVFSLLVSLSYSADTIELLPGKITGTVQFSNETVLNGSVSASATDGSGSASASFTGNTFSLLVAAGKTWRLSVNASLDAGGQGSSSLNANLTDEVSVGAGETVTKNLSVATTRVVADVQVSNGGLTSIASLQASGSQGTQYFSSSSQGLGWVTALPFNQATIYGTANVQSGAGQVSTQSLAQQTVSPSGGGAIATWVLDAAFSAGAIQGMVDFQGLVSPTNSTLVLYNQNWSHLGSAELNNGTGNGSFQFNNLLPGNLNVYAYFYFPNSQLTAYRQAAVSAGSVTEINFTGSVAMASIDLELTGFLTRSTIGGGNLYGSTYNNTSANATLPSTGPFSVVIDPGQWLFSQVSLYGYDASSPSDYLYYSISIYDYARGSTPVTFGPGESKTLPSFVLNTAQADLTFDVTEPAGATSETLISGASISGSANIFDSSGQPIQQISVYNSNWGSAQARPRVRVVAPPGTYQLSANGTVDGSNVSFGQFSLNLTAPLPTSVGTNVAVQPIPGTTVVFDQVTSPGVTSGTALPVGPQLPAGYSAVSASGQSTFYNITTTAQFDGSVDVALAFDPSLVSPELLSNLSILSYDSATQQWIDVTSSVDPVANTVTGTVSSLSLFVVGITHDPVLGAVEVPEAPKKDVVLTFSAAFTDADASDVHSAIWTWGDGSTSAGVIDAATGTISGQHVYAQSATHTGSLTVTDSTGSSDTVAFTVAMRTVQKLTILGGSGNPGEIDSQTEYSKDGGQTWHAAYLTGGHPWGFIEGTNSWINQDPSPFVGLNEVVDFRVRFTAPDVIASPKMTFTINADNHASLSVNGIAVDDTVGGSQPDTKVVDADYIQPGVNTINIRLTDFGGWVGINFRIDLEVEAEEPLETVTPPPAIVSFTSGVQAVGWAFVYEIFATNSPTSYGATGLPAGFAFDSATGVISGIFTEPGLYEFGISATNAGGTATSTVVIEATLTQVFLELSDLAHVYNGAPKSATVTMWWSENLPISVTYDGSITPPTNAGSYTVNAAVMHPHYVGETTGTLVIDPAPASINVGNVTQPYTGHAISVPFTTAPAGLSATVTYNGSSAAPSAVGAYTVVATIVDPNYVASSATATLTITDTIAPEVTVPTEPIVVEATSAAGAAVSFTASALDNVDGVIAVGASHASGSIFPLGETLVTVTAQDAAGNIGNASFTVTVVDTIAPVILMNSGAPTPVAIDNAGFEQPFTTDHAANVTGWQVDGVAGVVYVPALPGRYVTGVAPEGRQVAFINIGSISQALGVTVEAGKTYTLSGYVGRRSDDPITTGRLALTTTTGVVLAHADSAMDQAIATFARYSTSFTPSAGHPQIGSALQIVLTNTSNQQVNFDNIVLTVSTAPATAPADITVEATSSAGATVDYSATAIDIVSGTVTVSGDPVSGSTFAIGSTAVTLGATDAAGNPSLETFNVIVRDTTKPVLNIPADQTIEATSAAGAIATFSITANDAVGAIVTSSAASGTVFPLGTTTVEVSAIDDAGNEATGSFTITVVDSTIPVLHLPANQVIEATSPAGAVATFAASASDVVNGNVPVALAPESGSMFAIGTTVVQANATDAAGNTASGAFTITVSDTTAPVIAPLDNLVVEATSAAGAVVEFTPSALDIVDGAVSVTASPASGSTFALGETLVTLTALDATGNSTTANFTVTVVDTTAPLISTLANIVAEATSAAGAVVTFAVSANDIVDGDVLVNASHASGNVFPIGTTKVTLETIDAAGNASSSSFTITVRDTTAPVIAAIDGQTLEATGPAGAIATFVATATDAVGATISYSIAPGSTFGLGSTTVTVTAADAAGNTSTASFAIVVRDTTAPALFPPTAQMLEATSAAGAVAAYTATAFDIVSGSVPVAFSIESGSTFALGTTTVTASTIDAAGNAAAAVFSIVVVDTTAPVITAPANLVLEATGPGGAIATFSASALDIVSGNVAVSASKSSGSLFALGTTTVVLGATDAAGNSSSVSFTVTVIDTTAPTITVPEDIVLDSTTVMGATATYNVTSSDIVDGALTVSLSKASGTIFPIGTTVVTATVTDAAGNTATKTFNVTVRAPAAALVNQIRALNGTINGSIQQRTNHGVTLNGGAKITGELLAVGTPNTRLNGKPAFGGTVDSTGSANPAGYTVTLNGNASLGKLVRRYDAVAMPTVAAPSTPTGTRGVNLNKSSDAIGSWSTLKDLTLNGNVGSVTVPAGVYGNFTANGGSGFALGVAGATTPAVYHFQSLTLNGNSTFKVVGPVIIVVKNGINVNASMGSSANPAWLDLRVSNGGVTLNGNVNFDGYVTAPSGTVTINGNSELRGGLVADKLVLNGNSELTLLRR